jgi:ribosomal-protein-alanine N-acetyltransferase
MFVLELSKPSTISLGAVVPDRRRARELAGYVICARYADVWHVMNVAVDPPLRRQGVASALLEAMIEAAGAEEPFTLEVRPSNTGAIALYERFGFRAAGTRPRYYHDTGEDALIMWRTAETLSSKVS